MGYRVGYNSGCRGILQAENWIAALTKDAEHISIFFFVFTPKFGSDGKLAYFLEGVRLTTILNTTSTERGEEKKKSP